ncbi:DUF3251 domain-containing protein [Escherichia ruysiae]|uniref:DUF3251 domain-containing protein n=1 Tax=Escherichia TaxID=561 RepID=UPI000CF76AA0|nr:MULTISPECIES: DUF3251 domain-containing protein [Escherichia]MBY7188533.1 DUF3251 domain-containing protein [Escherichia ruysiae]MBY7309386.1 DUF3251 domain-containing protein [Escherichia ruysiae]MBY7364039.1 DUF3251 domain-containing protein [Escherichia coli]
MNVNKFFTGVMAASTMLVLSGCDYVEKTKVVDELTKQQEEQKARIDQLEKQLEQQHKKIGTIEKQNISVINSTKTLAQVVKEIKRQQDYFVFTEFNPAQTKYFILNNGSVGLAGRILSIEASENGSVIHMSLVNLLSVPVSNIGFHATWGGEKPTDQKEYAKWQQLLFSTTMNSTLKLLPGQWQDINLTLKGVSPNNLKYLKLAINMQNINFDDLPPADNRQKKSKK